MAGVLLGIGNALVEFVAKMPQNLLGNVKIVRNKGGFFHTTEAEFEVMEQKLAECDEVKCSGGGSVANSLKAFAKLGGKAMFVGRIGDDELGAYFAEGLQKFGICPILDKAKAQKSGCTIVWLDADGEKTGQELFLPAVSGIQYLGGQYVR